MARDAANVSPLWPGVRLVTSGRQNMPDFLTAREARFGLVVLVLGVPACAWGAAEFYGALALLEFSLVLFIVWRNLVRRKAGPGRAEYFSGMEVADE